MTRRYHHYVTVEQAAEALHISVNEVLALLNCGQLRRSPGRSGEAVLINSMDVELARKRLESLRRLDGDVQQ
ncbi:hypothetical protein ARTHRO9AX_220117 [Arthrobacter sp. 9AX]|uniref:hypothetical protein n=1 Tax=Arthrobacter sp. 9AX TaxID=2653131 RepID=UPI0012F3C11A|nr:hypothetical protein [Arthrobacter sp. 9AX]VXC16098.1 hypothetical protein ARTHRO9AX_220117 [Arthrobacter sp. 9AX]